MEDIVLPYVDSMMEADGGCCCEHCKADVMALTLNRLPPRYVVSEKGRMIVKLDTYESQFHTDIITALSEAIRLVRSHPRHACT